MRKIITIIAVLFCLFAGFAGFAEDKVRTNAGSDVIQRVLYEDPRGDYGVVLRVDTSTYEQEITEDDMKEIIKHFKALAVADELDGWHTKWAVHHVTDSSKRTPTYKYADKDKIKDGMNGSAIDLIFQFVTPQDLDEGQKLLDAGYPFVTFVVLEPGFKDDPPTAILHMYKNGYIIGFWLHQVNFERALKNAPKQVK